MPPKILCTKGKSIKAAVASPCIVNDIAMPPPATGAYTGTLARRCQAGAGAVVDRRTANESVRHSIALTACLFQNSEFGKNARPRGNIQARLGWGKRRDSGPAQRFIPTGAQLA